MGNNLLIDRVEHKNSLVECIEQDGTLIAYIIRSQEMPEQTGFITPDNVKQQVGFIVYPKDGVIKRHLHLPIHRRLEGTSEVLLVRKGLLEVDLFTNEKKLIGTWELYEGDLIVLIDGGHGFRCKEDTVLLEIKQGPYTGMVEKERF